MTRLIVPFLRTPINIWKWGAVRTPGLANLMGEVQRGMQSPDLAVRQLTEARLTTGTLMWTSALTMAAAGFITGPGPGDPKEKEKLRATGWQPNSLKVGDTYYALDRVDPASFILTTAAAVASAVHEMDEADSDSVISLMIGASVRALSGRTYLASLSDAMEVWSDPERNLDTFIQRRASMFVPASAAARAVRQQTDPVFREVDSVMDAWKNTIPGLSSSLPTRRNYIGEPIANEAVTLLSPFATSSDKDDPVLNELYRLQTQGAIKFGKQSKTITEGGKRIQLNGENYDALQERTSSTLEIQGRTQRQALTELMSSSKYLDASDEDQGLAVERLIRKYRRAATTEVKSTRPELWLVQ